MAHDRPQVSIMIIEDDPVNAAQLVSIVTAISNDITVSTTAERGLLIWGHAFHSDKPYQILITDINLPGMNGKQLCQEIRDAEDMAQVKTRTQMIAISADPPAKHLLEACRLGAGCYLQKPIIREKLLEALQHTGLFADQ
jgi:CheY-like chemotaxis protein